jgi:hypothetical protein
MVFIVNINHCPTTKSIGVSLSGHSILACTHYHLTSTKLMVEQTDALLNKRDAELLSCLENK